VPKVLKEDAPKFRGIYLDAYNREKSCYYFPKREACLMAMSYSYDIQAKVWERMNELENAANTLQLPDFSNPIAAARAWADALEQKQLVESQNLLIESQKKILVIENEALVVANTEKQDQLDIVQPKAQALDRITNFTNGAICVTNAAKTLQMSPKRLFEWLLVNKWIYRRDGGTSKYAAFQSKIQSGYLQHKIVEFVRSSGYVDHTEQVLVTAKGVAKLATELENNLMAA
jgi:phage antirepressor YoqD-like protein